MQVSAAPADRDTIAAIATAAGAAGVGIVRLSGPRARAIASTLTGATLRARHAHHVRFLDADGAAIDDGIALWFRAPRSYTGEDVVELQAHGSPVLLAQLLRRCLALGARMARPGEFTERAFLEGRLDLAQAEAVADLIHAGSEAAARAARRALDGEFSHAVQALAERLVALRMLVEAGFDFPEEGIDLPVDVALASTLADAQAALADLRAAAARGRRLVDGLHVVLVGAPNVGKSSLLNALAAEERAIVDARAGTTRDLLRETIALDGIVVTLVDTAGLHASGDAVEREGMRRARAELARADLVLAVLDAARGDLSAQRSELAADLPDVQVLWLHNKADLTPGPTPAADGAIAKHNDNDNDNDNAAGEPEGFALEVSARSGAGLDALRARLRAAAGVDASVGTGSFSARERHLEALARADAHLAAARLRLDGGEAELAAEDLRLAHAALGEITGAVDADQLLGRIFAGFCIGK